MKKIIDFITEKAMEKEGYLEYNTWVNLCHQKEAHQQENIILCIFIEETKKTMNSLINF